MNKEIQKWCQKVLLVGLLSVLMPGSATWAAQEIPITECHGLSIEFSCGLPPYGWIAAEQQGREPQNAPTWNVGCVYGYAWAQEGETLLMPEIGLKYGLRRRTTPDSLGTITIKESTLYIPLSINVLTIVPEWKKMLTKKLVVGIGCEATVALSSYCYPKGKPAANLLKVISGLSRFSGSFFVSFKVVRNWGGYLGLLVKLPTNIAALRRLGDSSWYPDQTIYRKQVYAFRIDTTSLIEFNLGLDVIQLLEE